MKLDLLEGLFHEIELVDFPLLAFESVGCCNFFTTPGDSLTPP